MENNQATGTGAAFYLFNQEPRFIESPQELVVHFKGAECITLAEFYTLAASRLRFPSYFSSNMDSFNDLILDLSWISEKIKKIILSDYGKFISSEPRRREQIITILTSWINTENHVYIQDHALARQDIELAGGRFVTV